MTEADFDRLQRVFAGALECADEAALEAYLARECGADDELERNVRKLLAADDEADELLPEPPEGPRENGRDEALAERLVGKTVGSYTIKRVIGSGGAGVVYEAEQERPKRVVALKVLRSGFATASMLRRFEYESEVLARMRHPNIAQVYEAGTHETEYGPIPYFAMEYVEGSRTVVEHAEREGKSHVERLKLLATICDAVQHGHQHGVIHRDLTPRNILVDAAGAVKIIDFGVARAADPESRITTLQTDLGLLVGTVPYMSPEQAGGDPDEVDTRSDVYALGVVAYELLTGRLPFDVGKKLVHEAVRAIREDDPRPISSIDRIFRGDVETIVSKAMAKEKGQRYQTARELADDVLRYLRDEPIVGRPTSRWYQIEKFARRNKVLVGGVAATLLALVTGLVATSRALDRAIDAEAEALENLDVATAAEARARAEAEEARFRTYVASVAAAQGALERNDVATARAQLEAAPAEHRGFEWHYLTANLDQSTRSWPVASTGLGAGAYSPDGSTFAVGTHGAVVLVDRATGEERRLAGHGSWVRGPDFSPDGRLLVSPGSTDGTARVWETETGREILRLEHPRRDVRTARFSPDGGLIATGCVEDPEVRLWDAETGAEVGRLRGHAGFIHGLAFSPDGLRLATASTDETLRIWDLEARESLMVLRGHRARVRVVDWSPDGSFLASGSSDATVRIWDARDGRLLHALSGRGDGIEGVAVGPDELVASASRDGTVRIWDAGAGVLIRSLRGHSARLVGVAFSPDGSRLLSAGASIQGKLKEWDLAAAEDMTLLDGHLLRVRRHGFSPDGSALLTSSRASVRLWDAATGTESGVFVHASEACFSPDGRGVIAAGWDRALHLLDADSLVEERVLRTFDTDISGMASSPAAGVIVVALVDGSIHLLDPDTGRDELLLRTSGDKPDIVAFSPQGEVLATHSLREDAIRVWDVRSGSLRHVLEVPWELFGGLAFSPDGRQLATASGHGPLVVWDVETGSEVSRFEQRDRIVELEWSADGGRLVGAVDSVGDALLRFWDTSRWEIVCSIRGPGHLVSFSPDGRRLACGSAILHAEPTSTRSEAIRRARSARERIQAHVEDLFARLGDAAAVVARLEGDSTLDPDDREAGIRLARTRSGRKDALVESFWRTVASPDQGVELCAAVSTVADRLSILRPPGEHARSKLLQAAADYRCERFRAAHGNLVDIRQTIEEEASDLRAVAAAFTAMTNERRGRTEEARAGLEELRVLMSDPAYAADERNRHLLREAEELIEGAGKDGR